MGLRSRTVPTAEVSPAERQAAWEVFERYYERTDRARFDADLDAKDHVILLEADGRIVGFSTVCVEHVGDVVSVFSGDTVIDAAHHGASALQWAFFRYIASVKARHPRKLVAWFLISKGYKTYLLLARNFPNHWPRRDTPTPPWAQELLVTLARRRFGDALDPERLILRFPPGTHDRLRPDVAPTDGVTDPDVRYFLQANPGHADGDELCCLGLVDASLITSWPVKQLRRLRTR